MTIRPVPSVEAICDRCSRRYESGDFMIFGPDWPLQEELDEDEWLTVGEGDEAKHYCYDCWAYASAEDGEQEEDEDGNLIRVPKSPTKEASSVVPSADTTPMDTPS